MNLFITERILKIENQKPFDSNSFRKFTHIPENGSLCHCSKIRSGKDLGLLMRPNKCNWWCYPREREERRALCQFQASTGAEPSIPISSPVLPGTKYKQPFWPQKEGMQSNYEDTFHGWLYCVCLLGRLESRADVQQVWSGMAQDEKSINSISWQVNKYLLCAITVSDRFQDR